MVGVSSYMFLVRLVGFFDFSGGGGTSRVWCGDFLCVVFWLVGLGFCVCRFVCFCFVVGFVFVVVVR